MKKLEQRVRDVAVILANQQVCKLYKIPEEMRQTPCDFFGYMPGGRIVMIECKQVQAASLKVGAKGGILPHQLVALRECHIAGGIAIVLWQRGNWANAFPIHSVVHHATGRRSLPWIDTGSTTVDGCIGEVANDRNLAGYLQRFLTAQAEAMQQLQASPASN